METVIAVSDCLPVRPAMMHRFGETIRGRAASKSEAVSAMWGWKERSRLGDRFQRGSSLMRSIFSPLFYVRTRTHIAEQFPGNRRCYTAARCTDYPTSINAMVRSVQNRFKRGVIEATQVANGKTKFTRNSAMLLCGIYILAGFWIPSENVTE